MSPSLALRDGALKSELNTLEHCETDPCETWYHSMFETSFSKVKWNKVYRSKCRLEVDVDQMHEGEKNRLGVQDARISAVPHPHCTN